MTGRVTVSVALILVAFLVLALGWFTMGQVVALREDMRGLVFADANRAEQNIATLSLTYTTEQGDPHTVTVSGDADNPGEVARLLKEQLRADEKEFPRRR